MISRPPNYAVVAVLVVLAILANFAIVATNADSADLEEAETNVVTPDEDKPWYLSHTMPLVILSGILFVMISLLLGVHQLYQTRFAR